MAGHAFFETELGTCGIGWGDRGIVRTAILPSTSSGLERCGPEIVDHLPDAIVTAIRAITGLLAGGPVDLRSLPLDLTGVGETDRRIYEVVRAIPPGATLTYGQVATQAGDAGLARAVGQAMGHNPCPIIIPCHRVLASGGRSGGFSAPGGIATKRRLLAIESVHACRDGDLFS